MARSGEPSAECILAGQGEHFGWVEHLRKPILPIFDDDFDGVRFALPILRAMNCQYGFWSQVVLE